MKIDFKIQTDRGHAYLHEGRFWAVVRGDCADLSVNGRRLYEELHKVYGRPARGVVTETEEAILYSDKPKEKEE